MPPASAVDDGRHERVPERWPRAPPALDMRSLSPGSRREPEPWPPAYRQVVLVTSATRRQWLFNAPAM
jgi:hypothetical protein